MIRLLTEADCPAYDLRIKWSVTQLYAQDLTQRKDRVEIKSHQSVRETFTAGVAICFPLLFQHTSITLYSRVERMAWIIWVGRVSGMDGFLVKIQ